MSHVCPVCSEATQELIAEKLEGIGDALIGLSEGAEGGIGKQIERGLYAVAAAIERLSND